MVLIALGVVAAVRYGSATPFSAAALTPVFSLDTLAFFTFICFAFSGLDLGPLMGGEIVDPRRNVPRAVLISGVIITLIYVLGTAALLVALPHDQIGILSGVGVAIAAVQEKMGLGFLAGISALLIALGGLGGISSWLAGSSRVPYVAGIDRYLPPTFGRLHDRWGTPHVALLVTGGISSAIILFGFIGSSVEETYSQLALFTTIVYFIPYLYLFASLVRLSVPSGVVPGVIPVPGGRIGALLVGGVGFLTTAVAIAFAFVPPEGTNAPLFVGKIAGGCVALLIIGGIFYLRGRRTA
jgi:amino acid transporter